jgi:cytosine/adenosine deaminase-related metal-dependent hydrolase
MIIRARIIVTMNGAPVENGAVAVAGSRIIDVGTFADVKERNAGEVIDLGEQVLLPGLINAHCHLDYTCFRDKIAPQKSFTDWIRTINLEKAKLSNDDYVASIEEGFAEAQKYGTTAIVNLEAFPQLIARVASPPLRTWWCAELIDVRSPERAAEIVDRAMELLQYARNNAIGLAPHAPFTASADLYRRCDEVGGRENILLTTHLAESREETEMFRDGSGALFDFMNEIGLPMNAGGAQTPFEYLSEQVALDQRWLVAHANELSRSDFERLEKCSKFHVVHCPRSHRFFGHPPFQLQKFRSVGLNICLGTDSLASNSDLNLFAEMRALQQAQPDLAAVQILEMVTVNSARAVRLPHQIGQISSGFIPDMLAIPVTVSPTDVFDSIVRFEKPISWMMVGGEVRVPSTK